MDNEVLRGIGLGGKPRVGLEKVWMVPLGPDGEPMIERGVELGAKTQGFRFSPAEDWGSEDGLGDGLRDDSRICLSETKTWSMDLELGSVPVETMALLWGMTVEEYADMIRWMKEKRWLVYLTGEEWSLT